MKLRRGEEEGKIAFAVRVVNTHGDFITPAEAVGLVDRRSYKDLTKEKLAAQLSIAWRQNKLAKEKLTKQPVRFGPVNRQEVVSETVEKIKRMNKRVTVNDVPYGELLAFAGKSRDDIVSVIEDLLYDTPLAELKEKHGGLYEAISKLV
jgi:hypothetical protein